MTLINKRFPANTSLDFTTFLNNKKIDGELYAYLQSLSYPNNKKETIVLKKDMPVQTTICSALGIKSPKTYRAHLNYLVEAGYVVDNKTEYYLPNQEEIFFLIPLETLKFLNDCLKEQVVKIYIYLGQRWKYKKNDYTFTLEEIAEHIGMKINNHQRNYDIINNALVCLTNNGLINYVEYFENNKPRKRLTGFSLEYKQPNNNKKDR